jgi:hypothetical protein
MEKLHASGLRANFSPGISMQGYRKRVNLTGLVSAA